MLCPGTRDSGWAVRHRSCKGMGERACAWEMRCNSQGEGKNKRMHMEVLMQGSVRLAEL